MKDEIFDVVNEHDEVVDQLPRAEVHRRGLRHRAVHVLVFNGRGQVFLQKRSHQKDTHPGVWDSSASGHLDRGEAYDDCAVRELREEIGLVIAEPPRRRFKLPACAATDQEFVWVYEAQSEGPFRLQPEEVDAGGWFEPDQVTAWVRCRPADFASGFVLLWEHGWATRQETGPGAPPAAF